METLNYDTLEKLNKEWTVFLDSIPWSTGSSIPTTNKIFVSKRNKWLRKMIRKYDVGLAELKKHFVHD